MKRTEDKIKAILEQSTYSLIYVVAETQLNDDGYPVIIIHGSFI